jgi:hypothetical protein
MIRQGLIAVDPLLDDHREPRQGPVISEVAIVRFGEDLQGIAYGLRRSLANDQNAVVVYEAVAEMRSV